MTNTLPGKAGRCSIAAAHAAASLTGAYYTESYGSTLAGQWQLTRLPALATRLCHTESNPMEDTLAGQWQPRRLPAKPGWPSATHTTADPANDPEMTLTSLSFRKLLLNPIDGAYNRDSIHQSVLLRLFHRLRGIVSTRMLAKDLGGPWETHAEHDRLPSIEAAEGLKAMGNPCRTRSVVYM
jgi:hypothetical protein